MRTVESGGCGCSKSDADSQIRKSYFWHEISSIIKAKLHSPMVDATEGFHCILYLSLSNVYCVCRIYARFMDEEGKKTKVKRDKSGKKCRKVTRHRLLVDSK